jgi:hypothetical protein
MDWIERWFGISPDNGDGTVEWLIIVAIVMIGVGALTLAFPQWRQMLLRLCNVLGIAQSSGRGG